MNETWWRKANELDEDQSEIVSLPLAGSHLVVGPPGSGKTNLLLLRASFLSRAGQANIAVISFNRMLKEFIASGSANYPFDSERIQTLRSWGARFARSQGVTIDLDGSFEDVRLRILEALETIAETINEQYKLDCILIDEAQDYLTREIDVMRKLSRSIFAVGDDRQRIYAADGALGLLANFCRQAKPLRYHYRNGTAICRFVDGMSRQNESGLLDTSNYDEHRYPSSVNRHKGIPLEDQVRRAALEIETQLMAYPNEWIGVLCFRKVNVREAARMFETTGIAGKFQVQLFNEGYEDLDQERPVILLTMHSAKGLEFRAVHILAIDDISGRTHEHRVAFTAATRAKTSLTIYHRDAAPGYIENGLMAVRPEPVSPPTLDELFGFES